MGMVELGRRCESGSQAIRSRATLFGHLVAKELVTVELCEAILNNRDLSHVRSQLLKLWAKPEKMFEAQLANHSGTEIADIVSERKQAGLKSFRDSISEFINYLDEIE